jgi:hypothetical protein
MPALTDDQLAAWKQLQWATALITSQFRRDLAAAGLSLEQFDVLVHWPGPRPGHCRCTS